MAGEPAALDLGGRFHLIGLDTLLAGHLRQVMRVGALAPADDDHQVDLVRELLGGRLLAGGGVAERVDHAHLADAVHAALQERPHELGEVRLRLRRLGEDADAAGQVVRQVLDLIDAGDGVGSALGPAEDTAHLLVVRVAEDDDGEALIDEPLRPLL